MILWAPQDPYDETYATASIRGTVVRSTEPCAECHETTVKRVQPLVIEWQKGSDLIGDFTFPSAGSSDIMITERVAQDLQARFKAFEPGPVEMVAEQPVPRRARIVRLPYAGPPLRDLWVTAWSHLDLQRSSISLRKDCGTCGTKRWMLDGTEVTDRGYDPKRDEVWAKRVPRKPGMGALVRAKELEGVDIFHLVEFPGWIVFTDRVRDFILERGYTNVSFREIGETF
jgi:hypothetical protein